MISPVAASPDGGDTMSSEARHHTITIQNQNLVLEIQVPVVDHSITRTIGQFCDIWLGRFDRDFFRREFDHVREITAQQLIDCASRGLERVDDGEKHNLERKLKMCRAARDIDRWTYPISGHQIWDRWIWRTGTNRLLGSGLCWAEPWTKIDVMLFVPLGSKPAGLVDCEQITDDQHLMDRLGIVEDQQATVLAVVFEPHEQAAALAPGAMRERYQDPAHVPSRPFLEQFDLWWQHYRDRPRLHVWTNWPELIKDSAGVWDWQHAGTHLPDPSIDWTMFSHSQAYRGDDGDHDLFVQVDRPIDLTDFLFWMDDQHTVYYHERWDFVLRRRTSRRSTQRIEVSRTE